MNRPRAFAGIAAVLPLAVVSISGMATASNQGNNKSVARYTVTTLTAKAPVSIKVLRGGYYSGASSSLALIPGMKTKVNVPAGSKGLIDVRYTLEAQCFGVSDGYCEVYAYVDGTLMSPTTTFAMASTFGGTTSAIDAWIGASMERTIVVGPGSHVVSLKARLTGADSFDVDEQSLAIEVFPV